ncbi:MAG TPA: hypothetical protein VF773_15355 [Verrucomicrobiae bacterium]
MSSNKTVFLALAAILFAIGCVAPQPKPFQTPFNEEEFAAYAKNGTGRIVGQAFLKTRAGDVKVGAGNTVQLAPVTPYTTEMRQRVTLNGERMLQADPRIEPYVRKTVADAGGNFEFANLPAGEYYLSCVITWEVPSGSVLIPTGGIAYSTAKLGEGETVKVVVTR